MTRPTLTIVGHRPRTTEARPVGGFRSHAEADIDALLCMADYETHYEQITLNYGGRRYTPDLVATCAHGPRLAVEVKPCENIARGELRHDMLDNASPLWLICDVFVVAFPFETWLCRGISSGWFECGITDGHFEINEPADWLAPKEPTA